MRFEDFYLKNLTENKDYSILYPKVKNGIVGDLEVIEGQIPNTQSIAATLTDYEVLDGIREIPMDEFSGPKSVFYAADDFKKSRNLAEQIKINKKIMPLIIVVDKDGPYILEGAHRYVALYYLGVKSLPALVVIDKEEI